MGYSSAVAAFNVGCTLKIIWEHFKTPHLGHTQFGWSLYNELTEQEGRTCKHRTEAGRRDRQ